MALIQILPRFDYEFQRDSMTLMLKTLSSGRRRTLKDLFKGFDYTFIIDCDDQGLNGKISFYFEVPDIEKEKSMQTLKTMFKEKADVFDADPLPKRQCMNTLHARDDEDAERKQKKRLATFNDPQIFLYILGLLSKRTRITIDFSIRKEFLASGLFRGVSTDVQAECLIRVWGNTKYDRNVIKDISDNISSLTAGERQLQIDYKDSYRTTNMTGSELLNFIQFPSIRTQKNLLDRVYFLEVGQITLQPEEFASGLRVGTLYHPVMRDREIRISYEQLRKHMEISGMTGSGKSSFFEEAVDSILLDKVLGKKNVPGFTLFDPMESSALGVIDKILKLKHDGHDIDPLLKKVHYIDLNDDDYVFPIALLYKGIEPTEILDFFKMLFSDTTTVQIDRLMSDAINALLKDDQEYSIADIQKIFENEELREEIKMRISDDPYAAESLQFLSAKFNSTQLDPIRNRLSPFLNTEHKKLMFGLTGKYDSLKDIRKWMDEGHILLFNLAGMKDFDIKVIIGYIVLRYYLAARQRPDNSRMHMLFNDECQKSQIPKYQDIIAEGRKPGLMFCPMTQYIERYEDNFLKAILGNIDTKVSFRQGDTGARKIIMNTPNCPIDTDALKRLRDRVGYLTTADQGKVKTIMIEVKPPYRYTAGELVPHDNTRDSQIKQQVNKEKNKNFAKELMARDWMTKAEAEKVVFKKHFAKKAELKKAEERGEMEDLWEK